jgi:hypothetical protein
MGQRAQAGPPAAELFLNSNKPPAVPGQKACSIASRATRTDSTPLADSFLMLPATFMGQRIQVASTIARARGSNRLRSCIRIVAYIACESYLSPRWGLSGSHFLPTACAVGCILTPLPRLKGWLSRIRSNQVAFPQGAMLATACGQECPRHTGGGLALNQAALSAWWEPVQRSFVGNPSRAKDSTTSG